MSRFHPTALIFSGFFLLGILIILWGGVAAGSDPQSTDECSPEWLVFYGDGAWYH